MAHNLPVDLGIDGLEDPVVVGEGGFALVYRAHQPAFRREVAVKVLTVGDLDDETALRFERECQAMGAVSEHPHIVTVHGAGFTVTGRPYLVMAYLPGGSLQERVDRAGPLGWTAATLQGVHLAGALETAHQSGIVHRDVKPGNVLLSGYGEVQLTDFGIARIAGARETARGVVTASVAHAAPEVVDGQRPTVAADVYSLASTLHELLAGRAAFVRPGDLSILPVLRRIGDEPPPDLRPQGIPDAVVAVLERAMAKDPAERFATAAEFGRALQAARYHLDLEPGRLSIPPTAGPVPSPPAGSPPARRAAPGIATGTRPLPGGEPAPAGDGPALPPPPLPSPAGTPGSPVADAGSPGGHGGASPPVAGPGPTDPRATLPVGPGARRGPEPGGTPDAGTGAGPSVPGATGAGGGDPSGPAARAGGPAAEASAAAFPGEAFPGEARPGEARADRSDRRDARPGDVSPPRATVRLDRHHLGRIPGTPPLGGPVPGPPARPDGTPPAPPPPPGPGAPGRRHAVVDVGTSPDATAVRPRPGTAPVRSLSGRASRPSARRRAGAVTTAVVLGGATLGAVGLWRGRASPPEPAPPVTSAAVARYAGEYTAQARSDFFEPCAERHPPKYCECLWADLQANVPWADYARIDQDIEHGQPWQETALASYISACDEQFPSSTTVSSSPPRR